MYSRALALIFAICLVEVTALESHEFKADGCEISSPRYRGSVQIVCSGENGIEGSLALLFSVPSSDDVACREMNAQVEVDGIVDQDNVQTITVCPAQNHSWIGRGLCLNRRMYSEAEHEVRLRLLDLDMIEIHTCATAFSLEIVWSSPDMQQNARVVVSAASSNHFKSLRNLVRNGLPDYSGKILIYDLGLTRDQRREAQLWQRCECRSFAFHEYPPH
eukprot:2223221-Rhodomonas_salina.1